MYLHSAFHKLLSQRASHKTLASTPTRASLGQQRQGNTPWWNLGRNLGGTRLKVGARPSLTGSGCGFYWLTRSLLSAHANEVSEARWRSQGSGSDGGCGQTMGGGGGGVGGNYSWEGDTGWHTAGVSERYSWAARVSSAGRRSKPAFCTDLGWEQKWKCLHSTLVFTQTAPAPAASDSNQELAGRRQAVSTPRVI